MLTISWRCLFLVAFGLNLVVVAVLRDRLLWGWAFCVNYNKRGLCYFMSMIPLLLSLCHRSTVFVPSMIPKPTSWSFHSHSFCNLQLQQLNTCTSFCITLCGIFEVFVEFFIRILPEHFFALYPSVSFSCEYQMQLASFSAFCSLLSYETKIIFITKNFITKNVHFRSLILRNSLPANPEICHTFWNIWLARTKVHLCNMKSSPFEDCIVFSNVAFINSSPSSSLSAYT